MNIRLSKEILAMPKDEALAEIERRLMTMIKDSSRSPEKLMVIKLKLEEAQERIAAFKHRADTVKNNCF